MNEGQKTIYQEITVRIPNDDVDAVANYIIENIAGGLILEEEAQSSVTAIRFYLSSETASADLLAGLQRYVRAINPLHDTIAVAQKTIQDIDWIAEYRKSVNPIPVGESITISPPWDLGRFPGRTEIILEPKMAFGTGRHETSRSCLAEMESLDFHGRSVLDLGCGSGILGIYAALRGAREVVGYDIDPLAVENSRENYTLNQVEAICRAEEGSLDDIPDDRQFNIIVANIIKDVIVPLIGPLAGHLSPGGILILSGLLERDRADIETALANHNLHDYSIRREAEWITYTVRRP